MEGDPEALQCASQRKRRPGTRRDGVIRETRDADRCKTLRSATFPEEEPTYNGARVVRGAYASLTRAPYVHTLDILAAPG